MVPYVFRSGWDSNPRAVARKLISSQPRYDLFDTAPSMLTRLTGEINAYSVVLEFLYAAHNVSGSQA